MTQVIQAHDVKKHNSRKSVWMVYRNGVYDVTKFLAEHPGGEGPLLEAGGQDATIAFDDVGHSPAAVTMMKKYKIGELAPGQGCQKSSKKSINKAPISPKAERRVQNIVVPRETPSSKLKWALLALGLAIIVGVAYKKYGSG